MFATIAAVVLRILSNPLGNAFQKRLTERNQNPLWVNFSTLALLALLSVFPASTVDWTRFSPEFWKYSLLMGIFCATGNACLVAALQRGELSVLGPINAWKSLVGMICAFFLLGEIPTFAGLAGVGLIVFGSYVVLDASPERFVPFARSQSVDLVARRGDDFGGDGSGFHQKVVLLSDTNVALYVWAILGAVFSFATLFPFRVDVKKEFVAALAPRRALEYVALVACVGTMQRATNYVFARLDVGVALALFQLSTLVGVALGWRFFHETGVVKKLLGSCAMVAGSVALVFFN